MAEQIDCALDLLRRLDPSKVQESVNDILTLAPHLTDELMSCVDQPLKIAQCPVSGKEYLVCDYNKDGDSYRSPWCNQYFPSIEDGAFPSGRIRQLEVACNDAFQTYRELYYGGGCSSVYMWDLETGFAVVVLIQKGRLYFTLVAPSGQWDSIHVVEVTERTKTLINYKTTSTILLSMNSDSECGNLKLAGSLTRQGEQDSGLERFESHVANIGRIVEDMELKLRSSLQQVYFGKTRDICNDLRSATALKEKQKQHEIQQELINKLA